MKDQVILTPFGEMKVLSDNDREFPSFSIYLNDELVSITEYNAATNRVRTIAYNNSDDEPATITDYNK